MANHCEQPSRDDRARDYVLGRLSEANRSAYEDHLAGCTECAELVMRDDDGLSGLERVAAEHREVPGPLGGILRRPGLAAALAAGVIVLVLGYPAILGFYRLPRIEGSLDALRREHARQAADFETRLQTLRSEAEELRAATRGGVVAIHFLARPTRDTGPVETLHVGADQPLVYLGVEVAPLDVPPDDASTYRFEIRSAGRVVWSRSLAGAEVRSDLDSARGAVILAVPLSNLPVGDYEIEVSWDEAAGTPTIFRKPFRIGR